MAEPAARTPLALPCAPYTSRNPFFKPVFLEEPLRAFAEPQNTETRLLPAAIKAHYTSRSNDYCFSSGLVLMSLQEVEECLYSESESAVAFGFSYCGMGHINLYVYDHESGCVLTLRDGGSNDHDRSEAARRRRDAIASAERVELEKWASEHMR